jgi:hypothetical protein
MHALNHEKWLKEKQAQKCIQNLKKHGFDAFFFQGLDDARSFILKKISPYDSFGFGGSDTTRKLDIIDELKTMNKIIYDHWDESFSAEESLDIRRKQLLCDCFFCSANAISLTGEIVNVDGVGNRTSAMAFGPRNVMIIAGVNKLSPNLNAAVNRVHEIAGPLRAKSLQMETPCAETGICNDCNTPQRICRVTTILHRKPLLTDVSVILVNEDLGY